ncbi:MAG: 4'-phosphopantetheinyl transferase superfamily protein [Spirochaetes bacterium]|nr:4'-phosphopantetheinyl transferase superfamily protein [Spirochaetota bacterium]
MKNLIGNDIVDITDTILLDKYKDLRFIKRILDPIEIYQLKKTPYPGHLLWYFWSAKEAAYKALKKYDEKIIFCHKEFKVNILEFQKLVKKKIGILYYKGIKLNLSWKASMNWIHCHALFQNTKKPEKMITKIMKADQIPIPDNFFTEKETVSIYSPLSQAVRVLAKNLLHQNGLKLAEIIRLPQLRRFSPPLIFHNSQLVNDWDISLSHDGSYIACSIAKN